MSINKILLAMALGLALTACSNQEPAADAAGTLEEMKELSADLVIIDLPGSAGMALAQRLRKAHPACQVALAAEPGTAASRAKADAARIRLVRRPLVGDVVEQILALVGWDD